MGEANNHPGGPPLEGAVVDPPPIDAARVEALFVAHGAEVRRFVLGVVRDPELASDVLQATFAKAVELGHTAHCDTLKGWLFRVAYHEALAAKRRLGIAEQAQRRLALGGGKSQERSGPDERLIRQETIEAVRRALGALPDEQRRVVRARMYEEKSFAEIAEEFRLPLGTVLTRMRRALDKLRRALPPED